MVWMHPSDSVHHETIRLVSLKVRLRKRMAAVVSTRTLLCETLLGAISASCEWDAKAMRRRNALQKAIRAKLEEAWSLFRCRRGPPKQHAYPKTSAADHAACLWAESPGGTHSERCDIAIIGSFSGGSSFRSLAHGCSKPR